MTDAERELKLKSEYTLAWLAWGFLILAGEFVVSAANRTPVLLVAVGAFVVLEGLAIRRKKAGDTLSEHVWKFYLGGWARIPLVLGIVALLGSRLYELGLDVTLTLSTPLGVVDVGRFSLIGGLVGWLVPHFLGRGRWG